MVGLGNPGPEYVETRHNLGFAVVERLAAEAGGVFASRGFQCEVSLIRVAATPALLLKPQTFMNRSGAAVFDWIERLGLLPANLVVAHDDLDLPLGRIRIGAGAGPGGHRGVLSIQEWLGTREFARLRIGIGRPETGEAAADHVLAGVSEGRGAARGRGRRLVRRRALLSGADGVATAMTRYNGRDVPDVTSFA